MKPILSHLKESGVRTEGPTLREEPPEGHTAWLWCPAQWWYGVCVEGKGKLKGRQAPTVWDSKEGEHKASQATAWPWPDTEVDVMVYACFPQRGYQHWEVPKRWGLVGGSEVMGVWALEYCGTCLSSSWVHSFFLPPLSFSLPPALFLFPGLRYKPCLMETNPTGPPKVEQEPSEGHFFHILVVVALVTKNCLT